MKTSRKTSGSRQAPAFTLIELLVVISIIALLISILLPALGKARQTAKALICQASQKQIGVGMGAYLNANKTYYPGDHWEPGKSTIVWPARIRTFLGPNTEAVFACATAPSEFRWPKLASGTTDARYATTGKYVGWQEDDVIYDGGISRGSLRVWTYGYNGFGEREDYSASRIYGLGEHIRHPKEWLVEQKKVDNTSSTDIGWSEVPDSRVQFPSDLIVIGDSNRDSYWDTSISMQSDLPMGKDPKDATVRPGFVHAKKTQFLFADTHVAAKSREECTDNRVPSQIGLWNVDRKPHYTY